MSGLPSSHLIPQSIFRHIGLLVMVMAIMEGFCTLGFLSVYDITQSWVKDIQDKISIEIPAYNNIDKKVVEQSDIDSDIVKIKELLFNDPIITDISSQKIDIDNTEINDDRFNIPSPAFITLSLHEDRAENAESRVIGLIENSFPNAIIMPQSEIQNTIEKTALILSAVFGGLTLSVFMATAIILSSTIRMQLKAQEDSITLIHLMGAHVNDISKLFKQAIMIPFLWGSVIGFGICLMSSYFLLPILNIHDKGFDFIYSVALIFVFFIILCRFVTHITVTGALRGMP